MVKNATGSEHPAGGYDDARAGKLVELFGFLDGSVELHVARKQAVGSVLG
jgi:hypothetical protein